MTRSPLPHLQWHLRGLDIFDCDNKPIGSLSLFGDHDGVAKNRDDLNARINQHPALVTACEAALAHIVHEVQAGFMRTGKSFTPTQLKEAVDALPVCQQLRAALGQGKPSD